MKQNPASLIQLKTITPPFLIAIALVISCVASLPAPNAFGVVPAPDGGYPGFNTAEGQNALLHLTTGTANTALGWLSLENVTTASFNTGVGAGTLVLNGGDQNTATGAAALLLNTTGDHNTANGALALLNNTEGRFNTASGANALNSNTTGEGNTAYGSRALENNTTGAANIALGFNAGAHLTTGAFNIDIGNIGVADEFNTIRIGTGQTRTFIAGIRGRTTGFADAVPVLIDSVGQLGTTSSSRRYKREIKPMDQTSEAILGLKPVTFHYKSDSTGTLQFGLIAEEVAQVNPDLVVRDENGEIYTVRYEAVNAMLLNEFLKEHRIVQELKSTAAKQEATITDLKSTVAKQEALIAQQQQDFKSAIARQQKEMQALAANLREQEAKIQKVSVQLAAASLSLGGPTQQVVKNP